jgi:hypothetical protein
MTFLILKFVDFEENYAVLRKWEECDQSSKAVLSNKSQNYANVCLNVCLGNLDMFKAFQEILLTLGQIDQVYSEEMEARMIDEEMRGAAVVNP